MANKTTPERFEEEVDRLADERGISFSAALRLKTGGDIRVTLSNSGLLSI